MDPAYSEELTFTIVIGDECTTDRITAISSLADIVYYVDLNEAVPLQPQWAQLRVECPKSFRITRVVASLDQPLSPAETAILSQDASDGHMTLQTNDLVLDGQTWSIKVYMTSTYSTDTSFEAYHAFSIEFRDSCWDSELQAPVFDS